MTTDESTTAVAEETLRASTTSDNQSSAFLTPGPRPSAPSVEVLRVPGGYEDLAGSKDQSCDEIIIEVGDPPASATD